MLEHKHMGKVPFSIKSEFALPISIFFILSQHHYLVVIIELILIVVSGNFLLCIHFLSNFLSLARPVCRTQHTHSLSVSLCISLSSLCLSLSLFLFSLSLSLSLSLFHSLLSLYRSISSFTFQLSAKVCLHQPGLEYPWQQALSCWLLDCSWAGWPSSKNRWQLIIPRELLKLWFPHR